MAVFGGLNYTGLQAVNLKSSGGIRFGGFDANAGTLYLNSVSLENPRQWGLPDKTGVFGISGTFAVDLPVVASSGYLSTIVTVAGIRAEDGLIVVPQRRDAGNIISARGALFVANAVGGDGVITLLLVNAFATATVASTATVFGYTAVR